MKKILLLGCLAYTSSALAGSPPRQVVVGPEDTVYGVAYNEGILTRSLISANNLQPPYTLTPGQVLVIPAKNEHIAGSGESLQTIADTYAVNVDVLAHENNLHPSHDVRQGDILVIPARDTESITETLMTPAPEIATTTLAPLPLVKEATPQNQPRELPSDIAKELAAEQFEKKTPAKSEPQEPLLAKKDTSSKEKEEKKEKTLKEELKKEEASEKKKKKASENVEKPAPPKEITFIWPVQGEMLKEFKAGSQDGIIIKVEEDTPVKATAEGEVIYAGNEIKNLGNLILIKHPQGYVSAYAHLSETLVKKGEKVRQGAVIANSGTAGEAKTGQLHFEIREGKKPVNPLEKLKSTPE